MNCFDIGEDANFHDLTQRRLFHTRFIGHIHCETIKSVCYFGKHYIVSGSDDRKIYIYHKESGEIAHILDAPGIFIPFFFESLLLSLRTHVFALKKT